jgi:hypothetical protein
VSLRDAGEACGEDFGGLQCEAGPEPGLFELRLELNERVVDAAELPEVSACRQAQEVCGGDGGAEGEAVGGLVELAAQAQEYGRTGLELVHADLLWSRSATLP